MHLQKIKKIRAEPNATALLSQLYDYDNAPCRKDFRRLRELYNATSKASLIVKKRIEKMRSQVDKIKVEV